MKNAFLFSLLLLMFFSCDSTNNEDSTTPQKKPILSYKTEADLVDDVKTKKEQMALVEVGQLMPTGILRSLDSTSFSSDIYKGKLLFLDFWATWCGPCLRGTPIFNALGEKYRSEKVEFISISVDDEFRFWKKFIKENNWTGQNVWLGMKEEAPLFSFTYSKVEDIENILIALPQYVAISPDGQILSKNRKGPSDPEFEKEIKELIKKYTN